MTCHEYALCTIFKLINIVYDCILINIQTQIQNILNIDLGYSFNLGNLINVLNWVWIWLNINF